MGRNAYRKIAVLLLSAALLPVLGGCGTAKKDDAKGSTAQESETAAAADPEMGACGLTAMELAQDMNIGWNLGNSMDAYGNGVAAETAWGNPQISETLIRAVKDAGFNTIRIPVSYLGRVGEGPDYTIDSAWLDRLQEVVDYALAADLYVIINIHHDGNNDKANGAWIDITEPDQTAVQEKFRKMWEQISAQFKDYDQRLIFESMNEIHDGTYQAPGANAATYYGNVNALNQIFVDTVRAGGGNNEKRCLLVPGYNTNIDYTIQGFTVPEDPADDRIMLSVHFYDPYQYALEENMNTVVWGSDAPGNCGWGNEDHVDTLFDRLKTTYIDNGIPVIIGEYGAINKHQDAYRNYYMEYVTKAACDRGIVPVYWDNGYNGDFGFALFDRNNGTVLHQGMLDAMMQAASGKDYTVQRPS